MQKLSHFIRKHSKSGSLSSPSTSTPSFEEDIYLYRKQRGVNLGSWFVLERWIAESPFQNAASPGQSDLDVARGGDAKQTLERHWDRWIMEDDFKWIKQRGFNAVRIPIGYYHICGTDPSVLKGTEFEAYQSTYESAWLRIVNAIELAHRYGIGVLIDLHAAPGKQNTDSHGGTSNPPTFFSSKHNMQHTTSVLSTLLKHLTPLPYPNIIGIELLNEPAPPSDPALQKWYTDTIKALRNVNPNMPIYIGECWRPKEYSRFADTLPAQPGSSGFLIVDHHLYRCFTKEDIHTPASQHAYNVAKSPGALAECGTSIVIGEWSGALNPGSLSGSLNHIEQQRNFVIAELELIEKYAGGSFFWTFKKEQAGDTGWSLRDAVGAGTFPDFLGLRARRDWSKDGEGREERKEGERTKASTEHANYWNQFKGNYEHWRFDDGFRDGWDAAYRFFSSSTSGEGSVSELGFKDAYAKRLLVEHVKARGNGKAEWEYEHGVKQGMDAARRDFKGHYCS